MTTPTALQTENNKTVSDHVGSFFGLDGYSESVGFPSRITVTGVGFNTPSGTQTSTPYNNPSGTGASSGFLTPSGASGSWSMPG